MKSEPPPYVVSSSEPQIVEGRLAQVKSFLLRAH